MHLCHFDKIRIAQWYSGNLFYYSISVWLHYFSGFKSIGSVIVISPVSLSFSTRQSITDTLPAFLTTLRYSSHETRAGKLRLKSQVERCCICILCLVVRPPSANGRSHMNPSKCQSTSMTQQRPSV